MNNLHDPMWDAIDLGPDPDLGVKYIQPFASSLPTSERVASDELPWRRIVEAADTDNEFSDALMALGTFRAFGFHTPAYSAAVEVYEDGSTNHVLYVAHVNGKQFEEVDFSDSSVRELYIEAGHRLLDYLPYCFVNGIHYLTDVTKIDQFLLVDSPRGKAKLTMVDLELDHYITPYRDQLDLFLDRFIKPLEQKTGRSAWELRAHRWQVIRNAPGANEYPENED